MMVGIEGELRDKAYLDQEIAFGENDFEAMRLRVLAQIDKDPQILVRLMHESYALNDKIEAYCRAMAARDARTLSDESLHSFFAEWFDMIHLAGGYILLPLFIEADLEQRVRAAVENYLPDTDVAEIFRILTTPKKPGTAEAEEASFLRVAAAGGPERERLVAEHLERFDWIRNNGLNGVFMTREDMDTRLRIITRDEARDRLRERGETQAAVRKSMHEYARKIAAADPSSAHVIDTLQEAIYFRSWRTERYYRNAALVRGVFDEVSQRFLILDDLVFYFTPEEIIAGIEAGTFAQWMADARSRKEGYACLAHGGRVLVYQGDDLY